MKTGKQLVPAGLALGALMAGVVVAGNAQAAENPFGAAELPGGYMLASADKAGEGKCGEGKCGEGKCGEDAEKKSGEGKCGEGADKKSGEGKCGEGKCGG